MLRTCSYLDITLCLFDPPMQWDRNKLYNIATAIATVFIQLNAVESIQLELKNC